MPKGRVLSVNGDGNCFFTSLDFFIHRPNLRRDLTDWVEAHYEEYFKFLYEKKEEFDRELYLLKHDKQWNVPLGDSLPYAACHFLQRRVNVVIMSSRDSHNIIKDMTQVSRTSGEMIVYGEEYQEHTPSIILYHFFSHYSVVIVDD
jgi:hypothetical protein